jgi:hypothetical protein
VTLKEKLEHLGARMREERRDGADLVAVVAKGLVEAAELGKGYATEEIREKIRDAAKNALACERIDEAGRLMDLLEWLKS